MPTDLTPEKWLDFWEHFKGLPHQIKAVEKLGRHIRKADPLLMLEEAEWVGDYRGPEPEAKPRNPLKVKYMSQRDNASGTGYRECFSSSCAMLACYWGKVSTDDEYNRVRVSFGDTTSFEAQLATLRHLGLQADFRTDGNPADLEREINAGRPVAVGWLHKGRVDAPSGGGHWSVVIGYTARTWIQNDPNGEALLVPGGYNPNERSGAGQVYSRKNWNPRWMPGGTGGWYLTCRGPKG